MIWRKILDSSATMQEAAEQNDWKTLNKLIESRQKLLEEFFSEPVARYQQLRLERIRADIEKILQQDALTRQLSERNKAILARGLQTINKGKQAIRYYR